MKCVAVAAAKDDEDCYDGERRFVVYSGSLDGSVKVWRLSEDRPLVEPVTETGPAAPPMPALLESDAWTYPRRAVALAPPPAQAWAPYQQAPPELMKRVATFAAAITATGGEEEAGISKMYGRMGNGGREAGEVGGAIC